MAALPRCCSYIVPHAFGAARLHLVAALLLGKNAKKAAKKAS